MCWLAGMESYREPVGIEVGIEVGEDTRKI